MSNTIIYNFEFESGNRKRTIYPKNLLNCYKVIVYTDDNLKLDIYDNKGLRESREVFGNGIHSFLLFSNPIKIKIKRKVKQNVKILFHCFN